MTKNFTYNEGIYTHASMQHPDPLESILQKIHKGIVPNGEHYIDPTEAWARARYKQERNPQKYYPEWIISEKFALHFAQELQKVFWNDAVDVISLCSGWALKEKKMSRHLKVQDALVSDISSFLIRTAIENLKKRGIQSIWAVINFENPDTFLDLKELYTHLDSPGNRYRIYTYLWLTLWNEANGIVWENIHKISSLLDAGDYFMFDYAVHDSSISPQALEKKYAGEENVAGVISLFSKLWLQYKKDFLAECVYLQDDDGSYAIKQRVFFLDDKTILHAWKEYFFAWETYYTTRISQRFNQETGQIESYLHDAGIKVVNKVTESGRWAILATLY